MSFYTPQQEQSLVAFLTALGNQDDALPAMLQQQLHAIGLNLENRIVELPTVAASLPSLNKAYQEALTEARVNPEEQGATLVSSEHQDSHAQLQDRAVQILTDSDPVQAAQQKLPRSSGTIASNPFKRLFGRG